MPPFSSIFKVVKKGGGIFMKQRTMLYLFAFSAVMVSATVYAGETKPEIQIAAESTTGSLKNVEME